MKGNHSLSSTERLLRNQYTRYPAGERPHRRNHPPRGIPSLLASSSVQCLPLPLPKTWYVHPMGSHCLLPIWGLQSGERCTPEAVRETQSHLAYHCERTRCLLLQLHICRSIHPKGSRSPSTTSGPPAALHLQLLPCTAHPHFPKDIRLHSPSITATSSPALSVQQGHRCPDSPHILLLLTILEPQSGLPWQPKRRGHTIRTCSTVWNLAGAPSTPPTCHFWLAFATRLPGQDCFCSSSATTATFQCALPLQLQSGLPWGVLFLLLYSSQC